MNEENSVEGFYQAVAKLLECEAHRYTTPLQKRTRWNNRLPGNGRFPGHGIVRYFGSTHVLVRLTNPSLNGLFNAEAALDAIKSSLAFVEN